MKARKPETTSSKVASIAGKILESTKHITNRRAKGSPLVVCVWDGRDHVAGFCTVPELRTIAASCLTQAPDRTPRKVSARTKKGSKK